MEQPERTGRPTNACPICGNDSWSAYFSGRTDFDAVFALCEHEQDALEAEEDAGMRTLNVEDHDLGESAPGYRLEAFCWAARFDSSATGVFMAVQPWLSPVERRARELEAHGYYKLPIAALKKMFMAQPHRWRTDSVFLMGWSEPQRVAELTVQAIAAVVEEMEPEWVEAVVEARQLADDLKVVASWCELPLHAVMGCVWALGARSMAA